MTKLIQLSTGDVLTPEQFRAANPEVIFAGDFPSAEYLASIGASLVDAPVPPPTTDDVNDERARRLVAGTTVTVTGNGPVALSGRDEDTRNLQGLAFAAQLRLADGNTTHQTTFRDAENVDHVLTPAQVLEMWSLGSAWIEQVYAASWALKDASGGIPADYANDGYWPQ